MKGRNSETVIEAAGGLVVRGEAAERVVLLVRRRGDGEWSLPKGTRRPAEPFEKAARRAVSGQTGLSVSLGAFAGIVANPCETGGAITRYWWMTADGSPPPPGDTAEIDRVEWVRWNEAPQRVAASSERAFLDAQLGQGTATRSPPSGFDLPAKGKGVRTSPYGRTP